MDYPQATVLGTSLLAMIFPASAALLQHQRCGVRAVQEPSVRPAAPQAAQHVCVPAALAAAHDVLLCTAGLHNGFKPAERTHPFALGFPSLPARLGNVDWRMAASLAAGTAVGSLAGSNVAVAAPPGALEAAFCVGMLFLGRKTLATAR